MPGYVNGVRFVRGNDPYALAGDSWEHAKSDAQQALDAANDALLGAKAYTDLEIANATLAEGTIDVTDSAVGGLIGTAGTSSRTQVDGRVNALAVTKAGHDAATAALVSDHESELRAALTRSGNRPVGQGELVINAADYASPQAAVDAAAAGGVPTVVRFPTGTQTWSSNLTVTTPDLTLDLSQSRITATAGGTALSVVGAPRTVILGGQIDLYGVGLKGVSITDSADAMVRDVTVTNPTPGPSSAAVTINQSPGGRVMDCRSSGCAIGVIIQGSPRSSVAGGLFQSCGRDGVLVYSGSDEVTVTAVTVDGFDLLSEGGRGGIHGYGVRGLVVTGCIIKSGGDSHGTVTSPCIRFRDAVDFTCNGNLVDGEGLAPGIGVQALSDMTQPLTGHGTISGNTIRNVGSAGIFVSLGITGQASGLLPVAISGNFIHGVRLRASSGKGITVAAAVDAVSISGGVISDCDQEGILCSAPFATIAGVMVRQTHRSASGSLSAVFISGGMAVLTGCVIMDDAAVPLTTVNPLRVLAGATVIEGANHYQGPIRNDGTVRSAVGGIASARLGFFGKAPVAKPSLAADPTPAQIRTHLVTLGLA